MEEVTEKMLKAAMKKAVELKVFPEYGSTDKYLKCWDDMREILETALRGQDS